MESIGTYVEIGANDGIQVSNTYCLAKKGWRGELVEPISKLANRASLNYCEYPLVSVHNIAIGAPGEKEIELSIAGLLSTARPELFEEYRHISWARESLTGESIKIKTTTLDEFLVFNNLHQNFELLVIDVEGYEAQVFSGFNIDHWKPKMIIVELSDTHPDLRALSQEHAGINLELIANGYIVVYKDAINTVLVSKEFYLDVFSLKF
jgi:FkbM family methyltransferase